jgi:hypothetical protein
LRPQNFAFLAQCRNGLLLLSVSVRIVGHELKGEFSVLGSLIEPGFEIIQPTGQPRIVPAQSIHSQGNQIAREKLGQRRGYGFEQRPVFHQIDISIDGVAHPGKHFFTTHNLLTWQTQSLGQTDPAFDSALGVIVAVVIENSFAPSPAKFRVITAREDDGVLDGDAALIVVAVEDPRLELSSCEFAFMHQQMKRMLMVIALFSHGAHARSQFFNRKKWSETGIYRSR